jgi:hypothetical protein
MWAGGTASSALRHFSHLENVLVAQRNRCAGPVTCYAALVQRCLSWTMLVLCGAGWVLGMALYVNGWVGV